MWSSGRALLSHLHVNEASPPEGDGSPSHVQTSNPCLGPGNPLPRPRPSPPCAGVAPCRLNLCIQVLITRLSLRKLPTRSLTLYSPPAVAPFLCLLTALWPLLSHLLILPWGADPSSASWSCWPRSLVTSKLVACGCSRAGSHPLPSSTQHGCHSTAHPLHPAKGFSLIPVSHHLRVAMHACLSHPSHLSTTRASQRQPLLSWGLSNSTHHQSAPWTCSCPPRLLHAVVSKGPCHTRT